MFHMRIGSKEGPTPAHVSCELRGQIINRLVAFTQHQLRFGWSRIVATHINLIRANLLQLWLNQTRNPV